MSRLARRNKTRWIKLWKSRGYAYRRGALWESWRWTMLPKLTFIERPIYDFESAGRQPDLLPQTLFERSQMNVGVRAV